MRLPRLSFSRDAHSSVIRYCVKLGAKPAGRITVLTDGCLVQLTGRDPQVVGLSLPTSVAIRHAKSAVRTALARVSVLSNGCTVHP